MQTNTPTETSPIIVRSTMPSTSPSSTSTTKQQEQLRSAFDEGASSVGIALIMGGMFGAPMAFLASKFAALAGCSAFATSMTTTSTGIGTFMATSACGMSLFSKQFNQKIAAINPASTATVESAPNSPVMAK